jgi:TldD protein
VTEPGESLAPLDFFRDRYGVDGASLASTLDLTLERRADHADLYFEYTTQDSVMLEEGIVKSGDRHIEQGVGVRVQTDERQGYAHSDDITVESLRVAASTARAICEPGASVDAVAVRGSSRPAHDSSTRGSSR